jgi:hypothetical protein
MQHVEYRRIIFKTLKLSYSLLGLGINTTAQCSLLGSSKRVGRLQAIGTACTYPPQCGGSPVFLPSSKTEVPSWQAIGYLLDLLAPAAS